MIDFLDLAYGFLELVGQSLRVTDARADPAVLRRRWPAIALFWLLALGGIGYGAWLLRSGEPKDLVLVFGSVWIVVPPAIAALLTQRWRALAWRDRHRGGG